MISWEVLWFDAIISSIFVNGLFKVRIFYANKLKSCLRHIDLL